MTESVLQKFKKNQNEIDTCRIDDVKFLWAKHEVA